MSILRVDQIQHSTGTAALTIDSSGRVLTSNKPAFQAYGVGGGTFASGSYMIFPSTIINIGNHYNTLTGVFTAPVTGNYFFTWSHIGNNGQTIWRFFIRQNDATVVGDFQLRLDGTATGTEYPANGNRNIIINASVNDTFRIFYTSDNASASFPGVNSPTSAYPTFGGFLL
jgi:hypothetical protein